MNLSESEVLNAANQLVEAFGSHDVPRYFASFSDNASFIFHNLDRVLTTRAAYEAEWALWEERDGFRVLACRSSDQRVQLQGDVAIFTHTVETDVRFGADSMTNCERETIVFARQSDGIWLGIHEHLSVLPQ